MALPRMFRVYRLGKPYKHIGNVEASTPEEALTKASEGHWKRFFATPEDQPTVTEGLVAFE